jgi:hypothetical protein
MCSRRALVGLHLLRHSAKLSQRRLQSDSSDSDPHGTAHSMLL